LFQPAINEYLHFLSPANRIIEVRKYFPISEPRGQCEGFNLLATMQRCRSLTFLEKETAKPLPLDT
jgi:hypothetical protein